jgi:cytochrome b pre-mRNA-processing protein 3
MILSKVLSNRFSRRPASARVIYEAIVAAARQPVLYEELNVPDTIDGRFDMIVMYIFLVLDRLKNAQGALQQELTDEFFRDMDRSLREMGVGDLSVGKKVRKMAEAYQGRILAYRGASAASNDELERVLKRNVYAGLNNVTVQPLAALFRNTQVRLGSQEIADIAAGKIEL